MSTFAPGFEGNSLNRRQSRYLLMTLGATLTQQQAQVRLSAYLSGHGLRLTKERMSILATVWEQKRPFAAADLVAALEAKGFHVSRSTAYQTLTLRCRDSLPAYAWRRGGALHFCPTRLHTSCMPWLRQNPRGKGPDHDGSPGRQEIRGIHA